MGTGSKVDDRAEENTTPHGNVKWLWVGGDNIGYQCTSEYYKSTAWVFVYIIMITPSCAPTQYLYRNSTLSVKQYGVVHYQVTGLSYMIVIAGNTTLRHEYDN